MNNYVVLFVAIILLELAANGKLMRFIDVVASSAQAGSVKK